MDAGLQFETGNYNGVINGWAAFFSCDRARDLAIAAGRVYRTPYVNPSVWNTTSTPARPSAWRGRTATSRVGSIQSTMALNMTAGGGVSIMLGAITQGNHTFFWNQDPDPNVAIASPAHQVAPWQAEQIVDPSRLTESNVKRVIGMTRPAPHSTELDGSWITCDFTGSWVRRANAAQTTWLSSAVHQSGTRGNPPNRVDTGTGYDAPDNNGNVRGSPDPPNPDATWDARVNGQRVIDVSRTIVEFPNITIVSGGTTLTGNAANLAARQDDAASYNATEGGISRYSRETVHINLRTATRPLGETVQIPPP